MRLLHIFAVIICSCAWVFVATLGVAGCSQFQAGGSIGTDNPKVAVTFIHNDSGALATVRVRVWGSMQNLLLKPAPYLDTTITADAKLEVDPTLLGLAQQYFNIEAESNSGLLAFQGNLMVADTNQDVQLALQESGSSIALPVPLEVSAPGIPVDTLDSGSVVLPLDTVASRNVAALVQEVCSQVSGTSPSYLVVLGTSVVISYDSTETMVALPAGRYSLVALDSALNVLYQQWVTILE